MIYSTMQKLKDQRKLTYIRTNCEDLSDHLLGFVCDVTEDLYAIREFEQEGNKSCLTVGRLADVVQLDWGGPMLEHLQNHGIDVVPYFNSEPEHAAASFAEAFNRSKANNLVVTFVMYSGDAQSGYVLNYDDECVHFREIVNGGRMSGEALLLLSSVKYIEYDGPVQQALHFACHVSE